MHEGDVRLRRRGVEEVGRIGPADGDGPVDRIPWTGGIGASFTDAADWRPRRSAVRDSGLRGSRRMSGARKYAVGLGCAAMSALAFAQAIAQESSATAPNPDSQYRLGPDSLPQEGVPKGEIRG